MTDRAALQPFPPGTVLVPGDDVVTRNRGEVLIGGAPLRILRLRAAGAGLVRRWFGGEPVGEARAHQQLARRLVDAGIAEPQPPTGAGSHLGVTVVIPVKDDPDGLTRTLAALRAEPDGPAVIDRIVVVDDGSARPVTVTGPDLTVLRNDRPTGPGPARQKALGEVASELVAFVDAGVEVGPADLSAIRDDLADRTVVAVAPRVLSRPADHPVGRYEQRRSALDLGPTPSIVAPGRLVSYVPTACMVTRVEALERIGGFDPGLRFGEDVDLVWRLGRIGTVRYRPAVTVEHPARPTLAAFAAQRLAYGSSAAPLAARHGDAVTPLAVSPWSLLIAALAIAGRPAAAIGTGIGTGLLLRPKIAPLPDLTVEALALTGRGHWFGAQACLTAVARNWWPVTLAAGLFLPRHRRRMIALLAAAFGRRLLDGPSEPAAAVSDLTLGAIDDLAYGLGVWRGAIEHRSARALRPVLLSWPGRSAASTDPAA
ncbi:MAG: mycofactocin biosynthesis glycosyltransferase MftF [Actinomycetota bacterium]